MFKSVNAGGNWSSVNTGLTATTINSLAIDPKLTNIIYVATDGEGLFKSIDGGGTWRAANAGLISFSVGSLVINPVMTNILYIWNINVL